MCMQISMDAMRLFLSVNAMPLRALRRRGGILSVDMFTHVDGSPEVVFCGIVITGESDDAVRRVVEDLEASGWHNYHVFEQVTSSQVKK